MSEKEVNTNRFEDFKINTKIKLAALWTSVMFCYVYGDYFSLYVPKKVEDFISGDTLLDSPVKLFLGAILMTIPALMIFASVVLKPKINRLLNIIFGIIYTAIMLLIAFTTTGAWWSFYVFFAIIESILTVIIFWTALKWPKLV
ncbi:hypothetical protein SAMN06265349_103594 [Flavobacterium resistens]|uniref:Uncharacterized protein n=1 Tax=Flavobacterium resistens TaxID=443612 RepID=A0A521DUF1_9FLAO|nr:DUF6326 family protein [Flavobacterium resistens]MRX68158.1 hypothetical protein [Flavobacterium resistens]SMO75275.1 hypothetical protein SAMN06265349_103594 [Flavobacterium resistens]